MLLKHVPMEIIAIHPNGITNYGHWNMHFNFLVVLEQKLNVMGNSHDIYIYARVFNNNYVLYLDVHVTWLSINVMFV